MNEKLLKFNSNLLNKIIYKKNIEFAIQEETLKPNEVSDIQGLLGLFLLEGSKDYEKMFSKNVDLSFFSDDKSLLDFSPVIV